MIRSDRWFTRDDSTGPSGSRNNDLTLPDLSGLLGEWHHLAFVYSVSQQLKGIYLDGQLAVSTDVSIDPLNDRTGFSWVRRRC